MWTMETWYTIVIYASFLLGIMLVITAGRIYGEVRKVRKLLEKTAKK